MSFDLGTYQQYQDYFKAIAKAHKLLGNGEDGKFVFGDEAVAMNGGKGWKGDQLWLDEPEPAGVTDSNSDNYLKEKKGILIVMGAPASKLFADEQTQYKKCEGIVEDIISFIIADYNEFTALIKKGSMRYGRADRIFSSTNFVGCRLEFVFIDPSGFPYTAANWIDPEP